MKIRRRARIAAFQALFEADSVGHPVAEALCRRAEEDRLPEAARTFARELVAGVLAHRQHLDDVIQEVAPEWPVDQMAIVDRNILRVAAYEILYAEGTPPKVAINEAVELAKTFGSDSSSRFVNGALGTLTARRHEFALERHSAGGAEDADEVGGAA